MPIANPAQGESCRTMLGAFRDLYNAALQLRIEAYQRRGFSLRYGTQALALKTVRKARQRFARYSLTAQQQALRWADIAFTAFVKRYKESKKPGFPRFKATA